MVSDPVRRTAQVVRHRRAGVTPRGVELRLGEEQDVGQVGARAGRRRAGPHRAGRPGRGRRRAGRRRSAARRAARRPAGPGRAGRAGQVGPGQVGPRPRSRRLAAPSSPPTSSCSSSRSSGEQLDRRQVAQGAGAGRAARPAPPGPASAARPRARWASISCTRRTTDSTAAISPRSSCSRHEVPPYVTCETCCPAPKQSKTVQPGQPRSRRSHGCRTGRRRRGGGRARRRACRRRSPPSRREGQQHAAQGEAARAVGHQLGFRHGGGRHGAILAGRVRGERDRRCRPSLSSRDVGVGRGR